MQQVDVEGITINYRASAPVPGRPPVVLLHGAGGNHRQFNYQFQALAPHWQAIVPDLPGHGQSGGQALTSIEAYGEWLLNFVDRLGLDRVVLGGHSMGGAIAQQVALMEPARLAALILLATGARLKVHPDFLSAFHSGTLPPGLAQALYSPQADPDLLRLAVEEMHQVPASTYYTDFSACNAFDFLDRIKEIRLPALLVYGTEDVMTPVKYARFLATTIDGSVLALIQGAGHMVMLEQPALVNQEIIGFLARFLR